MRLVVFWWRSYLNESDWPNPIAEVGDFAFYSTPGLMIAAQAPFVEYAPTSYPCYYIPPRFQLVGGGDWIGARRQGLLGFNSGYWSRSNWVIQVPYWFTVATFLIIATIPWLPWKFSLRTLLIATTLIAVVLGLVVRSIQS